MDSDSDIDPIDECREWVAKSIGGIVKRVNEIKQCQENLESRVSTLETSLNANNEEVQEKLDGTNAEIWQQSKRISVLETSDTVTKDVLKEQEKSLSELNSNTSKLDGRIHNLETSVNKIDQSIAATNTTMGHQDKRISEMESGNSQSELLNTFILGGINELKKNTTCENLIRDNLDLMDQDLSNVEDVLVGMRGMSTPNRSSVLSSQGAMGTQGAVRTEPEEAVPVSRQTGAAVPIDVAEVEIGEGVVRTEKVSSEQAPCTSGTAPSDDDVQIIGISEQGPNTSGTVPNDDDKEIISDQSSDTGTKRKRQGVARRFEDLSPEFAETLKAYDKNSSMDSAMNLNRVQRAYVKWYCETHVDQVPNDMMRGVMSEGLGLVFDGKETFEGKDLSKYLKDRMSYEKKKLAEKNKGISKKRKSMDSLLEKHMKR